jgi:hypothetical protein
MHIFFSCVLGMSIILIDSLNTQLEYSIILHDKMKVEKGYYILSVELCIYIFVFEVIKTTYNLNERLKKRQRF